MATVTVDPATVTVTAYNGYKASALIGGDTALSDSSDSTFAEVWTSTRVGDAVQDHAFAVFPAVANTGVLAGVSLVARVEYAAVGGAAQRRFDMQAETSPAGDYIGTFLHDPIEFGSTVPATGTTYTIADWTFSPGDMAATQAALAAGTFAVNMSALSDGTPPATPPADWMLRVYELQLVLTFISPCFDTLGATGLPGTADIAGSAFGTVGTYSGRTMLDLSVTVTASATGSIDDVPLNVILSRGIHRLDVFGGATVGPVAVSHGEPFNILIPADSVSREYTVTITDANLAYNGWASIADVQADLEAGMSVEFYADLDVGSGASATVSAASLRAGHKCVVFAPPLRRYPANGNGATGPKRHYPRSLSRRPGTF